MKKIDSDALGVLNKALGLTGRGSQVTELTDGVVDQALDIGPIVRRGRTAAGTEGIFVFRLRNGHTDAQSLTTIINPFNLAAGIAIAPFPDPIPDLFDLWILNASVLRVSGTGTLSAALFANYPASVMGVSKQGGGTLAIGITSHALAFWDALISENITFALLNQLGPLAKIGIRLPRSTLTQLVWATTSSATSIYDIIITVGLFPVALGQDALV